MPKVSVIMPVYNAEKYVSEAIDSILNQTFVDFEFIIINDGSSDNTKEIIKSCNDLRIKFVENERNLGIVPTLNKGLKLAKGQYIARMDADDISSLDRLEKQVNFLDKNKDIAVVGTAINVFGKNIKSYIKKFSEDYEQVKIDLLFSSALAHPSVMMRKSILNKFNLTYEEEYSGMEDYVLWWNIANVSKITNLPDVLLNYRIHENQITQSKDEELIKKMHCFTLKRLEIFNIYLNDYNRNVIQDYFDGKTNNLSVTDLESIINLLNDIFNKNIQKKIYEVELLKNVLEHLCFKIVDECYLSSKEKKELLRCVKKQSLISRYSLIKYYLKKLVK